MRSRWDQRWRCTALEGTRGDVFRVCPCFCPFPPASWEDSTTTCARPHLALSSRRGLSPSIFSRGWPHAAGLSNSRGTRLEWHNKRVAAVPNPSSRGPLGWRVAFSGRSGRSKSSDGRFGHVRFMKWFSEIDSVAAGDRQTRASLSSTQTRLRLLRPRHDSS